MKKYLWMWMLVVAVMLFTSAAHAACVAAGIRNRQLIYPLNRPIGVAYTCTADSLNTVTDTTIVGMTGQLQSMDIIIPGSNAPTSVTPTVKTVDGVSAYSGTEATATGRQAPDKPQAFSNGVTISQVIAGASGCTWTVVLNFL